MDGRSDPAGRPLLRRSRYHRRWPSNQCGGTGLPRPFAPAQGESLNRILARSDPTPGVASISPAFDDDFLWHRQDTFHDSFCQDLDDIESLVMATTQRPLARRCFDDVTGEPAWTSKPSWYQVSAQDRMIAPQTQRWMAERIHARETIELDTSHASFATRPTQVLELITDAASAI